MNELIEKELEACAERARKDAEAAAQACADRKAMEQKLLMGRVIAVLIATSQKHWIEESFSIDELVAELCNYVTQNMSDEEQLITFRVALEKGMSLYLEDR